jgi:hypothetical protein
MNPLAEANATVLAWLGRADVNVSLGPPQDGEGGRRSCDCGRWRWCPIRHCGRWASRTAYGYGSAT